jgi:hypothetical protein
LKKWGSNPRIEKRDDDMNRDALETIRNRLKNVKFAVNRAKSRIALAPLESEIRAYHELIGQVYQLEWVVELLGQQNKQCDLGL